MKSFFNPELRKKIKEAIEKGEHPEFNKPKNNPKPAVENIIKKVNLPPEEKEKFNAQLIEAAKKGDKAEVERLLKAGADVNAKNNDGWTALMKASENGRKEVVEMLINAGADVNAKNNDGKTRSEEHTSELQSR